MEIYLQEVAASTFMTDIAQTGSEGKDENGPYSHTA